MTAPFVVQGPEGSITVPVAVLTQLVVGAAESIEGAKVRRPRRSVQVAHADGRASVSLALAVRNGQLLPQVARSVQERVAEAVVGSCGLEVDRVDVTVEEVGG